MGDVKNSLRIGNCLDYIAGTIVVTSEILRYLSGAAGL